MADIDQDGIEDIQAADATEPEAIVGTEEESREEVSSDAALAEFKRRYEDERAARIEAERRAFEAQRQVHQASNEVDDTNLRLVESAINTVRTETNILKAEYRNAMSLNDYDRAAEIQEAMSLNAAKLLQLENGRQAMEARPRQAPPAPPPQDPVEALAQTLSAPSANWVRRNPQYATNPRLFQKMVAAHNLALADDIQPDTPDYFEYVEGVLGIRKSTVETAESPMSAAAAPAQRRAAPPAAPVSRNAGGSSRPIRLTPAELEAAEISHMTPAEYLAQKTRNMSKN